MPTVSTNGMTMHYIREGSGDPVLLLPGLLFGAEHWRPQIDALKDRFDVIAVDLRGQHHSQVTAEPAGYDMWNQAEDVFGLIQALGIGPVHCIGLSMGGFIAMRLALRHPETVRDLVLMATTCQAEDPEKVELYEGMRQVLEGGGLESVVTALPVIFFRDDYIADHPEAVEAWIQSLRDGDPAGFARASRAVDHRDDISDQVGAIGVPTLVIHGTEDAAIDADRAEDLAERIPGARLEWIEGAGHQSNVDSPFAANALISAFLDGHDVRAMSALNS